MKKVVFVGDKPSRTNVSHLAFVGARCFPRLVEWISAIGADYYVCLNSSNDELDVIETLLADGFRVIALGMSASERLNERNISHYCIPHPSGRNRKMNDAISVQEWLDLAKAYVEAEMSNRSA